MRVANRCAERDKWGPACSEMVPLSSRSKASMISRAFSSEMTYAVVVGSSGLIRQKRLLRC